MEEPKVARSQEIWMPCPLDENVRISNLGRVKRNRKLRRAKSYDQEGYERITIKGKTYRLHRLVAELFCENPNPEEYTVVDHINAIKNDNRAENLRWCTPAMNTKYASELGLIAKLNSKSAIVLVWNIETKECYLFRTVVEAAKRLGLNADKLSKVTAGKANQTKGYKAMRLNLIESYIDIQKGVQ